LGIQLGTIPDEHRNAGASEQKSLLVAAKIQKRHQYSHTFAYCGKFHYFSLLNLGKQSRNKFSTHPRRVHLIG